MPALLDKCRGSLVGGAVGDALGYEVEFMSLDAIRRRFGSRGIARYVLHDGVALFSDDTQMTLFTLEGIINGIEESKSVDTLAIYPYIRQAYLDWYATQTRQPAALPGSSLSAIAALWARRAPGNTCLSALSELSRGQRVANDSKGCGGVMRVAPIGIFGAISNIKPAETALLAAAAAYVTHHHIASSYASALMALIIERCLLPDNIDRSTFALIVGEALDKLPQYIPGDEHELHSFASLINQALDLGRSTIPQTEAIARLGQGWVADEALAIAIFSVMRHTADFESCIVCAVNHDGDSDSTGAIAGNIIGAILGYSSIPAHYLDNLELKSTILALANQLCNPSPNNEN